MSRLRRRIIIAAAAVTVLLAGAALVLTKTVRPNLVFAERYEVKGVDVSAYQGDIDWDRIAGQDISFAYIKATEGSGYTDDRSRENLEGARSAGLRVGAYHFFSYDSSGEAQAENFIRNVPADRVDLPPVIDVEFYGDYYSDPADREDVLRELDAMADKLREHYGTEPVIYCTGKAWRLYIKDTEYRLWIRNVYSPSLKDWDFWQYTDTARLEGYSGDEEYIDMNVFRGSPEELAEYGKG